MTASRPVSFSEMTGTAPIVVVAPHPDDESLGCGGLLAHAFENFGAHVICMNDGSASHPGSSECPPAALAEMRRLELEAAIAALGGSREDFTWLGFPDGGLHACPEEGLADEVSDIVDRVGAQRIFVPAEEDHHADHKAVARSAMLLCEARPELEIYAYPIWSRWDDPDFDANVRHYRPVSLEISAYHPQKSRAIQAHRSQLPGGVPDDPQGFSMSADFVEKFATGPEIFWRLM